MIGESSSLKKALGVTVADNIKAGRVQFNSLDVNKGDIFIALPGQRDGHEFVNEALANGASCAIISKDVAGEDADKLIKVEDTMVALNDLAEYKRINSKAKFIAVTGSVGKTSTREVVKTMLSAYGNSYASAKSFNNFLGVPLTLASMPDETEYAIIELGMNAPGELRNLTNMVVPDIAIITTISEGHIEFYCQAMKRDTSAPPSDNEQKPPAKNLKLNVKMKEAVKTLTCQEIGETESDDESDF